MNRSNKAVQINYSFEVITWISPANRIAARQGLPFGLILPEDRSAGIHGPATQSPPSAPLRAPAGANCSSEDHVASRPAAVAG